MKWFLNPNGKKNPDANFRARNNRAFLVMNGGRSFGLGEYILG